MSLILFIGVVAYVIFKYMNGEKIEGGYLEILSAFMYVPAFILPFARFLGFIVGRRDIPICPVCGRYNTVYKQQIGEQFGQTHDYSLSVSGGGDKANFRVSGNYNHATGTVIKQKLDRFTTRLALDYFVSEKMINQYFEGNTIEEIEEKVEEEVSPVTVSTEIQEEVKLENTTQLSFASPMGIRVSQYR